MDTGAALYRAGQFQEGLQWVERALAADPGNAALLNLAAACAAALGLLERAENLWRRAVRIKPDDAEALHNLGALLKKHGRCDEAETCFRQLIAAGHDVAETHFALGKLLEDGGRFAEAEAHYRRALALDPGFTKAEWNLSLLLLLLGKFDEGWRRHEARYRAMASEEGMALPRLPFPQWRGEPLAGKSLAVLSEQGHGDDIQFCRYVAELKQRGARWITLVCKATLKPLFAGLADADAVLSTQEAQSIDAHDYWTFLHSCPLRCGTAPDQIPARLPYLQAPSDRLVSWAFRLPVGLRVGLVWKGNPGHPNDARRSLPGLSTLAPLWRVPGLTFISLQKGQGEAEAAAPPPGQPLVNLGPAIADFADTAAIVSLLDLVISVDTAVAHLAGALNTPCWVLLPHQGVDWRWQLGRNDSPWYPGALRLFRQTADGDWSGTLEAVAQVLEGWRRTHAKTQQPAPSAHLDEAGRRKAIIRAGKTDLARWRNPGNLEPAWAHRAIKAAAWIPQGATVVDLGCGAMSIEPHLPPGTAYVPCDIVARDARTVLCDLNQAGPPPEAYAADRVLMLGLLEYLYAPKDALEALAKHGRRIICSYCPVDYSPGRDRRALGWVNDFSLRQLEDLFHAAGYWIKSQERIDPVQALFVLEPGEPERSAIKNIAVLSCANVGNFGDRLGYHNLCALLPGHARVRFYHHQPWTYAGEPVDLLVLGIGNSLFGPLLTDGLAEMVGRAKASLGIFGTQYRQETALPSRRLHGVLDRLDFWHARYEEDLLLYGKGRSNAFHLGDWLINCFPMAVPTDERLLEVGDDIWNDLPLDRTIQRIQRHKKVFSARLHPLLCALASAEQVAYAEQRELRGHESGKFKSMCLDIFGRPLPEHAFWPVDKASIGRYKEKVAANTQVLAGHMKLLTA